MFKSFGLAVFFAVAGVFIFPAPIWSEAQGTGAPIPALGVVKFNTTPSTPDPNDVLKLVNAARQDAHTPPLRANKVLGDIAEKRAADMAARQYYAHKSPDGKYYYDLFVNYNLKPEYSCENLDLVFVPNNQNVINEWLGSLKGHRECMLNNKIIEAGYAATKLTTIDFNGNSTTGYLIVAIHTTELN